MSCLLKLKLPYLYSTLELFVQWIKDGVYDFHQLPIVMKKHLEAEDEKKLREISTTDASMGKVSVYKGIHKWIPAPHRKLATIYTTITNPCSKFSPLAVYVYYMYCFAEILVYLARHYMISDSVKHTLLLFLQAQMPSLWQTSMT